MDQDELNTYCEFREQLATAEGAGSLNDFVGFLSYCAARLNRGDPVQAIWSDYLGRAS